MGKKGLVTSLTDTQIEILNDLIRTHPARRNWDRGVSGNLPGFGTILDEMNQAAGDADITSVVSGGISPIERLIVSLETGDIVRTVGINITEAFNDLSAVLTIGTDEEPDELMTVDLSDLAAIENYIVRCDVVLTTDKDYKYFLSPGVATAGAFQIALTFGQC